MTILFRKHRGSLDDSMKTLREFESEESLLKIVAEELATELIDGEIILKEYSSDPDNRIGWKHTNVVSIQTVDTSFVYGFYTNNP